MRGWIGFFSGAALLTVGCASSVELFEPDGGSSGTDAQTDAQSGPDGPIEPCAGAAPLCYEGWSGSPACCLTPGVAAECHAAGWSCPEGKLSEAECGRFDPVCQGADLGPGGLLDDCEVNADCALIDRTCCGVCGVPTAGDKTSVNVSKVEEYFAPMDCESVLCPECAVADNPYLVAHCDQTGFRPACAVGDLGSSIFTGCSENADCQIVPNSCCPCGPLGPGQVVSVRKDVDPSRVLCDLGRDCPDCTYQLPASALPSCVEGRCRILWEG